MVQWVLGQIPTNEKTQHSRPFYATVTSNNEVHLQTAAQLLTESVMKVNP